MAERVGWEVQVLSAKLNRVPRLREMDERKLRNVISD